ncbi:MAG TPA: flavodoxin-dependent (E)-4-hydroxy-3-methylbut-2-enyl-diphosphate synthase, partial [Bacteroidia bacterium]|nr:flavodoxin-dependent (E)-4-hydroxy-3-methylbut-2-enyl-diphosphate synthase [Bacteroidia bacterium]
AENYQNIVLSMKASNAQVMVQAYRLLVQHMKQAGMNYPLHLGVTEAGDGEDGRIKSAAGIGTLLEDGLGDTVRVSLTEDPEFEIPVAKMLVDRYTGRGKSHGIPMLKELDGKIILPYSPYEHERRKTRTVLNIGGHNPPRVIANYLGKEITPANLFAVGYQYSVPLDKWNITDLACDYVFVKDGSASFEIPGTLGIITNYSNWKTLSDRTRHYPLFNGEEYFSADKRSPEANFIVADSNIAQKEFIDKIKSDKTAVLILRATCDHAMAEIRRVFISLMENDCDVPVIIDRNLGNVGEDKFRLYAATDCGGLLLDGFGDGIILFEAAPGEKGVSPTVINSTAFGILQATRTRISKTEYISCPSCGRTLFDLQETTNKIRQRTSHLKGVKIGIMGCIVNGPGEMADADYGYVGTGPGKITLYKGKEVVKKNVPEADAVDALIDLIRQNGDWVEVKEAVH